MAQLQQGFSDSTQRAGIDGIKNRQNLDKCIKIKIQ